MPDGFLSREEGGRRGDGRWEMGGTETYLYRVANEVSKKEF